MFSKFSKEQGSVSIIVAIAITVLMAFSAITIDVGRVALEKQSLQNALDAACLAAAQDLPNNTIIAEQTAITYLKQNGYTEEDVEKIEFLNANKQIRISAVKAVEYTFAKIFNNGDNDTVNVIAAAEITSVFGPYKYALFSGSEMDLLQFRGQNTILGNVHSNASIKNAADVTGVVTAVSTIDSRVIASAGKIEGVSIIDMPNLSGVIDTANVVNQSTLINVYGATYTSNKDEYAMSAQQLNNLMLAYSTVLINGNLTINGSGINSTGGIIVTGDIEFNGSDVCMAAYDSICLFSLNGNITFNGGSGNVNGILYSPNGAITLNGGNGTFNGSIIGDIVKCDGGINLVYNAQVSESIPLTITRLVE